jgi:hypothetical protein
VVLQVFVARERLLAEFTLVRRQFGAVGVQVVGQVFAAREGLKIMAEKLQKLLKNSKTFLTFLQ